MAALDSAHLGEALERVASGLSVTARRNTARALSALLGHPQADQILAMSGRIHAAIEHADEWQARPLEIRFSGRGSDSPALAVAAFAAGLVSIRSGVWAVASQADREGFPACVTFSTEDVMGGDVMQVAA